MSACALPAEKLQDLDFCVIGIGVVALTALSAALMGACDLEGIKKQCRESTYWPQFVELAKADKVPANWCPGAIGRTVLGWAKAD